MEFFKKYTGGFAITSASIIAGLTLGYCLTSKREETSILIADTDNDGSLDRMIDTNWKIIFVNDPSLVPTDTPSHIICEFPKTIKIPSDIVTEDWSAVVRPLLEQCYYIISCPKPESTSPYHIP